MAISLTSLTLGLIRHTIQPESLTTPFLLWEAPNAPHDEPQLATGGVQPQLRPQVGSPMLLEVRKKAVSTTKSAPNAFALGITVGHTENNDIVVDDQSVSRFHAYFQESGEVWKVVDVGSRHGTWLDDVQLRPNAAFELRDGASLKFGAVTLTFLLPATLLKLASGSSK